MTTIVTIEECCNIPGTNNTICFINYFYKNKSIRINLTTDSDNVKVFDEIVNNLPTEDKNYTNTAIKVIFISSFVANIIFSISFFLDKK